VLPAGDSLYDKHALQLDGTPNQVLAHALLVRGDRREASSPA
jgi:hypothetical protein